MSDPEHVLYDLPQQIQRVSLRNGDHKLMFSKVSTERFKNSFLIHQCLPQLFNWLLFFGKRGWVCLGSLSFLFMYIAFLSMF